jgi:hypothetical protein
MNHSSALSLSRKTFWRQQRFWRIALPVLAGIAMVAALVVGLNAAFGSSGQPNASNGWGKNYPTAKTPGTVKLDPSVRPLIRQFVQTAVARKNLAAAYSLSGPAVIQGMSLKEWLKGNIAVVPFAVDGKTKTQIQIDYSYADRARLKVFLATPGRKVTNSPHSFYADVIKQNGKWVVNGWVPRWTPPIPTQPGR